MVHTTDMTQMHRSAGKHRRLSCLQAPDRAPAENSSARGHHSLLYHHHPNFPLFKKISGNDDFFLLGKCRLV